MPLKADQGSDHVQIFKDPDPYCRNIMDKDHILWDPDPGRVKVKNYFLNKALLIKNLNLAFLADPRQLENARPGNFCAFQKVSFPISSFRAEYEFFSGDIFEFFLRPFPMSGFAGFKYIYTYVYT